MISSFPFISTRLRTPETEAYAGKPTDGQHSYLGYNVKLVQPDVWAKAVEGRTCMVCQEMLYRPSSVCNEDRHRMCQPCAVKSLEVNPNKCPERCELPPNARVTEYRGDEDVFAGIKIHCPYHSSCEDVVTLGQVRAFEEVRKKQQENLSHPCDDLSEEDIKGFGLDFYWEELGLDVARGANQKVPQEQLKGHMATCPYRPIICRSCKKAVPKQLMSEHRKLGQCTGAAICERHCDRGLLKGEFEFHNEICLVDVIHLSEDSSDSTFLQDTLKQSASGIQSQSKWKRELTFLRVQDIQQLADADKRLDNAERSRKDTIEVWNLNYDSIAREKDEAKRKNTQLETRVAQLEQDLRQNPPMAKRFAVPACQGTRESIKTALQAGYEASKRTRKAPQLKKLAGDVANVTVDTCYLTVAGANYLGNRQHRDETIIHVHDVESLGNRKSSAIDWNRLCGTTASTAVYKDGDTVCVDWRWLKSELLPEGAGPDATIQVDVYSSDPTCCLSNTTELKSTDASNAINADGKSGWSHLAVIPVPQPAGATPEVEPMDFIIRITVNTGTAPRSSKVSKSKK